MTQTKTVSLKVHRNRAISRHATEMRKGIRECASRAKDDFGDRLQGYTVVIWTNDGHAAAFWDGTETLGPCPVGEYANHIIRRVQHQQDAERMVFGDEE